MDLVTKIKRMPSPSAAAISSRSLSPVIIVPVGRRARDENAR